MKEHGKDKPSTKDLLLRTGLKLFAANGFDGTSTRMIAHVSGATRSSIAFYFETKEAFYNAVIDIAVAEIRAFYQPFVDEVKADEAAGILTQENARCHIFRFIKRQVNWFFDEERADIVKLIIHEQSDQILKDSPLFSLFEDMVIGTLSYLIRVCTGIKDTTRSQMIALALNGSVQAMGEHRAFTNRLFAIQENKEIREQFLRDLTDMVLNHTRIILNALMKDAELS